MKTYVILASLLVVCLAKSREHHPHRDHRPPHHGPNPEEMFPDPGPPPGCPMEPMCTTRCKYGLKKDDKGCDTCECNPSPCEGFQCDGDTICVVSYMDCMMDVACFGHPKCVPPKPCSNMMCMIACPFGNKIDEFGCQICECKEGPEPKKPKEDTKCGENTCLEGQHCLEGKRCAIKPWCHRMTDFYRMMMELRRQNKPEPEPPVPGMVMQHEPQCEHDGGFKPKQCHDKHCWCVHENGTEIHGSRIPFLVRGEPRQQEDDEEKHCEKNKTIGARIKFHMRHNLENVDNHMDHIKKLVHEHMARWMTISREDILQVNVRTHEIHLLQIEVIVVHNGRTDLASALMHFHEHFAKQDLKVRVEPGQILEPVPKSVSIDRQFQPKRHIVGGCWGRVKAFYHHYPVAVISGSVAAGLLLLLAVIATTLACCCKSGRRNTRYEIKNYDKNLSFSNQLYNYPEVVTGDEKVNLSDKEKEAQDMDALA